MKIKYLNPPSIKIMENKYKEGEEVYAKVNPSLKLIIRRYVDRIYYCKIKENLLRKELVYFEREPLSNRVKRGISNEALNLAKVSSGVEYMPQPDY